MNAPMLEQIEAKIDQLPFPEQLWLVERLIHRLRMQTQPERTAQENQLLAMADDPDIQRELREIEAEFAGTEADGLSSNI